MLLLDKKVNLLPEEQNFIDSIIFTGANMFPWFNSYNSDGVFAGMSHVLMRRESGNLSGSSKNDLIKEGIICSPNYYHRIIPMFYRICEENNIKVKTVYRACLNLTSYEPNLYGKIHKDHVFDHHIFIMYWNQFDNGHTFLFDDDKKIIKIIEPEKNKVAIFDGKYNHARGFCSAGQARIALIITFGIDRS
jgi:hypothetical protein